MLKTHKIDIENMVMNILLSEVISILVYVYSYKSYFLNITKYSQITPKINEFKKYRWRVTFLGKLKVAFKIWQIRKLRNPAPPPSIIKQETKMDFLA